MDSVLFVSPQDPKACTLFEKLGYQTITLDSIASIQSVMEEKIVDLVVLDTFSIPEYDDLISLIRNQEHTKTVPIIVLGDSDKKNDEDNDGAIALEFIPRGISPGIVVSKAATMLRLRKMNGENPEAHFTEMNAALRDYSSKVEKDIKEAQSIQKATLPHTIPKLPGFDIAYSYEPLEELGGDWFYVQKEKSGNLSVILADVTGHGLAAAFIGGWIKLALHACKSEMPQERLSELNSLLEPQLPEGRFITVVGATINPASGTLSISRGGHPPSLLFRKSSNTVEKILGDGFALGFFSEIEFAQIDTKIESGDILFMCTDGITEAQNRDSKFFGQDFICDMLISNCDQSATELTKLSLDELNKFTDGRLLKDDVTIVIIKKL
jgi:phosphoserine phosphatase RsbU/P